MLICNAPFCKNNRNYNHAWCSKHRWEREKFKVKSFKQILLFIIPKQKLKPKYNPIKQKIYNIKQAPKRKESCLQKRYGITLYIYNDLLQKQNSCCAICKISILDHQQKNKSKRHFAVDHCHITKKVRGLLCYKCNMGLGYFNDNAELTQSATNYLTIRSLG